MSILKTIFWCFYPQAAGSPTDTTPILVHKKPVIPQKTGSGKADSNSSITPFNPAQIVTTLAAVEIPLAVQRLAKTDIYEAIICLGAVIRGETDHYDYVCQQVSSGCQKSCSRA